ncbi:hypothetical protein KPH14_007426 [Odynerus spinipes]|uniref:Sodium channel protein Nach n=1 Tax=Odynerus spinipes TaxID=1348599 RepID=A0AAD9VIL4_9HYME|nr:hypothetical protein KPH14_007426 [Odynerus spinipes]
MKVAVNNRNKRKQRPKRFESFCQAVQWYCTDTTLHGLKYVMDTELSYFERLFWLGIVALSSILAIGTIYMIAEEFQTYPTYTSIESTNYRTSGIPFPSVVICPTEHVDWNRVIDLEEKIFTNSTKKSSISTFRDILKKLSIISFGDFDFLEFLNERDLRELADINVTGVLLETMPQCRDLFSDCWWRNSYRDCCEIFELQKTEYGFCYAFNSEISEVRWNRTNDRESRPRRASSYGEWSGVQVTTHLGNISKSPDSEETDGVYVLIQGPGVWPNSGTMTPAGIALSIALDCISGYATQRVLELDDDRMPCKYDESGVYSQQSCISFCKRAHAVKYCGCNPSFLFPSNESIVDDKPAMLCDCPPECEYYFYKPKITSVPLSSGRKDIAMDVHFQTQTSFRYKTDIVFTKLDLLGNLRHPTFPYPNLIPANQRIGSNGERVLLLFRCSTPSIVSEKLLFFETFFETAEISMDLI